jgi:hypothetical protein
MTGMLARREDADRSPRRDERVQACLRTSGKRRRVKYMVLPRLSDGVNKVSRIFG